MKPLFLPICILVFLLLWTNALQAQTTQTNLNQVELMKQFIGTWKTEMGKDTSFMMEGKIFGKGLEF